MQKPDNSFDGDSLSPVTNGYNAYYGITQNPSADRMHFHEYYQFLILYSGAKHYMVNDNIYPVAYGKLMIIPPFHMHGMIDREKYPVYERALLSLTPEFLQNIGNRQLDFELIINNKTKDSQYCFDLSEEAADECKKLLSEIDTEGKHDTAWDRFSNVSRLFPALRMILEADSSNSYSEKMLSAPETLMHQILIYINAHFTEPLSLKQIAAKFGVSQSTLSHSFIQYAHQGVYDYILHRRIMMAKQRLYEDISLSEIAYQCGFGDYSNFLRAFTRITGKSPSAYRKDLNTGRSGA